MSKEARSPNDRERQRAPSLPFRNSDFGIPSTFGFGLTTASRCRVLRIRTCPTKYWLRSNGEPKARNDYGEWVQSENESYRADAANRLMASTPADECAAQPGSSRREEA